MNAPTTPDPHLVTLPVLVRVQDSAGRQWTLGPIPIEIDENTPGADNPFQAYSIIEGRVAAVIASGLTADIIGGLMAQSNKIGPSHLARVLQRADDTWRRQRGYTGRPVRRPLYWQHLAEAVQNAITQEQP